MAKVIALFQAECERCGWHTRQADQKWWARQMADAHEKVCPVPEYRRNGALMSCGCWTYEVMPGDSLGKQRYSCPVHGNVTTEKMNVDEPVPYMEGNGRWIAAPPAEPVEGAEG